MKKKFACLVPFLALSLFAEELPSEAVAPSPEVKEVAAADVSEEKTIDISKISESFGHLIAKNIETLGFELDLDRVIQGLQDSAAGREAPMSEMECVQAISSIQEGLFKKQSEENLKKADEFLTKNRKSSGIVSLEEGKLQYKVEKKGSGALVEAHFAPLIRYSGKFLDGTVFGSSKEDEKISLDETIPGFSKGLIGMKEGEKRTLYIHPELGYGTNGYLAPNSLLVFEVEIVKANVPVAAAEESISASTSGTTKSMPEAEIALPSNGESTIR